MGATVASYRVGCRRFFSISFSDLSDQSESEKRKRSPAAVGGLAGAAAGRRISPVRNEKRQSVRSPLLAR